MASNRDPLRFTEDKFKRGFAEHQARQLNILNGLLLELEEAEDDAADLGNRLETVQVVNMDLVKSNATLKKEVATLLDETHQLKEGIATARAVVQPDEDVKSKLIEIMEELKHRNLDCERVIANQYAALEAWQEWWSKVMRPYVIQCMDQVSIHNELNCEANRRVHERGTVKPPALNEFPVVIDSDGECHGVAP